MPDDPAAILAGIRERATTASTYDTWHLVGRDVSRLLAAVEAALKQHESKVPTRILAECGSDEAERYRYCVSCAKNPPWPCPAVVAISSALTGQEAQGA